jgi:DNA repair protein RadC
MRQRATSRAMKAPAASIVLSCCEPAAIALLPDTDLLDLFSTVGAAVSARFLIRRHCLTSWKLVLDYLRSAMGHRDTEQFRVLFLDKRNNLIADEAMWEGTVDHVPVYPREVARRAIGHNATAVILAHNHPSGGVTPSSADVKMTKLLADALTPLGITVHDHVIVAHDQHSSMRTLGLI